MGCLAGPRRPFGFNSTQRVGFRSCSKGFTGAIVRTRGWLRHLERKELMLMEYAGFFSAPLRDQPVSLLSIHAQQNEDDFIERLKARDERAFETLVRRYGARMLATARRFLGNEHDAHDIVQQALDRKSVV